MEAQELVCTRCWRGFFDTEAFEKCCRFDFASGSGNDVTVEAKSTVRETRDASLTSCAWCSYVNTFISASQDEEDSITVRLSPSLIKSCTPKGNNIFYLSISCHSPTGEWKAGSSLFLHAFTAAEDKASAYVTARPLRTDLNSEIAIYQMQTWLRDCKWHEHCSSLQNLPILPRRVIEVNLSGKQEPRLVESGGKRGAYATLSYCWGPVAFTTLNSSNYSQFLQSLDVKTLPQTIQDAITTTRRLGIPYLWIDALCIMQDSEDDKVKDITRMKDIYASSVVTIVAASSKNVSGGFLHYREYSEAVSVIPFRIRPGLFGTMSVNELGAVAYDERFEPIARRSWTLQEQFLAQRTLTFATHTMLWNCQAGTKSFGDSLYFPHDLDSGFNDNDEKYSLNINSLAVAKQQANLNKDEVLSCWLRLVTAYSLRCASLERDKLNAVAGIASHPVFCDTLGPGYFAGMWQYNLARQLTWYTADQHRTLSETDKFTFHRPYTYRAPSWSWASLEGGIIHFDYWFEDEDEPEPEILCEIVESSTELKFPNVHPFGEVLSAQLKVRAVLRKAWFNPPTSNVILLPEDAVGDDDRHANIEYDAMPFEEAWSGHVEGFMASYPDADLEEDPEDVYGTVSPNTRGTCDESGAFKHPVIVFCLPVSFVKTSANSVEGLLLALFEDGKQARYKRIGHFRRGKNDEFLEQPKRTITII